MPYHRPIPGRDTKQEVSGGLRMFAEAENLMQIAILLPASLFIGWLLGVWVGAKLHVAWLQYVGLGIGCVAGFVQMIRMALEAEKRATRADAEQAESGAAQAEKEQDGIRQAEKGQSGKGTGTFKG